jgi:hypothetical protein
MKYIKTNTLIKQVQPTAFIACTCLIDIRLHSMKDIKTNTLIHIN